MFDPEEFKRKYPDGTITEEQLYAEFGRTMPPPFPYPDPMKERPPAMDGARLGAIRARKISYVLFALFLVCAIAAEAFDLWSLVWAVPAFLGWYFIGRAGGLADARYLMRRRSE